MLRIYKWLIQPLSIPAFDLAVSQIACWLAAIGVLLLGFFKLSKLPLNETELFFGVLLVLITSLNCVVLGFVMPLVVRVAPK